MLCQIKVTGYPPKLRAQLEAAVNQFCAELPERFPCTTAEVRHAKEARETPAPKRPGKRPRKNG